MCFFGLLILDIHFADGLILWFFPSSFRFELLLLVNLLNNLASIDLDLLENIGLVGLSLDLDCFIDHLTQLTIAFIHLSVSLQQGLVSRCV